MEKGVDILVKLVEGILKALPQLISAVPQIIQSICTTLGEHLGDILWMGCKIIFELIKGIVQVIPTLLSEFPKICKSIFEVFKSFDFVQIGIWILQGVATGIANAVGSVIDTVIDACKDIYGSIKDFFGIHSPSHLMRDNIGNNIILGIGVGMDKTMPELNSDLQSNLDDLYTQLQTTVDLQTAKTTIGIVGANNIAMNTIDNNKDNNNIMQEVHNHYHISPQEMCDYLAPFMGDSIDEYNGGR